MTAFFRSLFRHFRPSDLGALLAVNLACTLPFVAALAGPLALRSSGLPGLAFLLTGFLVTGQAVAVGGRLLDRRFQKGQSPKVSFLEAWKAGWAEGLVVSAFLLGFFYLAFESLPFYLAEEPVFAAFSLITLGLGTLLVLGLLPYFLPARRREHLGLRAALGRSFRLMNDRPLLALATFGLGVGAVVMSLGTLGIFPGFAGLAALHQGAWDHATEVISPSRGRPGTSGP